jgi:membrane protease YdiL (CAAX protease family)
MTQYTPAQDGAPADAASRRSLSAAVARRPLLSFFVLACALSWWAWPLYVYGWLPQPIAAFGPFLAAIAVLSITEGWPGVTGLLRRMVQWRVPVRAYLFALGTPLLISGSAILLTLALGGQPPDGAQLALWSQIPVTLAIVMLVPGFGGAWEEPGWRGFALGRLEERFGLSAAPLLLGVFWVFWHLPLFLTGQILAPDVMVIIAASVVIASIFHAGRESVLIAMIWHATNNAVSGAYASQLFHGSDAIRLGLLTAAGWWLVAGAILVQRWRRNR